VASRTTRKGYHPLRRGASRTNRQRCGSYQLRSLAVERVAWGAGCNDLWWRPQDAQPKWGRAAAAKADRRDYLINCSEDREAPSWPS